MADADYSLVPVEHDPFEGDHSLIAVDYDPFASEKFLSPAVADWARQGAQKDLGHIVDAAHSLATLPERTFQASENYRLGGDYNPAPIVEAATLPLGTGAIAGVPLRAGETALGSGVIKPTAGLDMDEAARLARAKDMGFRTQMPLYHGTGAAFDEFKPVPTDAKGWVSPGASLARSPEIANEFAEMAGQGRIGGLYWSDNARANPQVYKLFHRADNPAALTLTGNETHPQVVATLQDAFDRGHDAVMLRNYTSPGGRVGDIIIVKNANQLRSVNAAFDPAKRESGNLLAGIAGALPVAGLAAGATDRDESE